MLVDATMDENGGCLMLMVDDVVFPAKMDAAGIAELNYCIGPISKPCKMNKTNKIIVRQKSRSQTGFCGTRSGTGFFEKPGLAPGCLAPRLNDTATSGRLADLARGHRAGVRAGHAKSARLTRDR